MYAANTIYVLSNQLTDVRVSESTLLVMSFSAAPDALMKLSNSTRSGSDRGKPSLSPASFRAARTAWTLPRPTYDERNARVDRPSSSPPSSSPPSSPPSSSPPSLSPSLAPSSPSSTSCSCLLSSLSGDESKTMCVFGFCVVCNPDKQTRAHQCSENIQLLQ